MESFEEKEAELQLGLWNNLQIQTTDVVKVFDRCLFTYGWPEREIYLSFKQIAGAYNKVGISAGDSSTDRLEGQLEVSLRGT